MLEFAAFLSIFDSKFRVFVFWCCWRCHFGLCEVLMSFCFCFFLQFLGSLQTKQSNNHENNW